MGPPVPFFWNRRAFFVHGTGKGEKTHRKPPKFAICGGFAGDSRLSDPPNLGIKANLRSDSAQCVGGRFIQSAGA
jgi:hypothetical protein